MTEETAFVREELENLRLSQRLAASAHRAVITAFHKLLQKRDQSFEGIKRLVLWHEAQAQQYRRLAGVTAMDKPDLTQESFYRQAEFHTAQAQLLRELWS